MGIRAHRLWASNGTLVWELSKREISQRYKGASLGVVWSILNPFLMLGVYWLAFGNILRSRWPGLPSEGDFVLILFIGLLVHGFLSEVIVQSPSLIPSNPAYVKKVVFPVAQLIWPKIVASLFHAFMNIVVYIVFYIAIKKEFPMSALAMPFILLALLPVAAGSAWLFSAFGVYLRDLAQVVPPLSTALLFVSSAIIPVESLSPSMRSLFNLNPLTFVIDQMRAVGFYHEFPSMAGLAVFLLCGLAFMVFARLTFGYLRRGFADVI